jgi:chemotaxis protein MotB
MSGSSSQPIIIVKKKGHGHHGHHGGAWKVAYADFVTAMMAFFLVMWIVGQSKAVRQSVAQYFRDPGAFSEGGRGLLPGAVSGATGGGQPQASSQHAAPDVELAKKALEAAAQRLREVIELKFGALKDRVEIRVTDEGLLIELREAPNDGFFATGSAVPKQETIDILAAIAGELGKLQNKVAIEGHTDRRAYARPDGYSNWDLSTDRANAARRVLTQRGLQPDQVEAVRGYADTRLRTPDDPYDAGNRRISIVVRRLDAAPMRQGDVKSVQPRH